MWVGKRGLESVFQREPQAMKKASGAIQGSSQWLGSAHPG